MYTLFHGDWAEDTNPWCPVCFDLSYDNLAETNEKVTAAIVATTRKGLLHGFSLERRARPDFEQCAEQHACVFCAGLLQVIDRFWREPSPRMSVRRIRTYELRVYQNGSVEMADSTPVYPRTPLTLLLFTPSGTKRVPNEPTVTQNTN